MLLNYHELTMGESRYSPQRRQQFLVICTVMASAMGYAVIQAGGLQSAKVSETTFPGGEFVYKYTMRDYAAAGSLVQSIGKDLDLKEQALADKVYTVFLDDPSVVTGGRQQRFASGLLATDAETKKDKKTLMATNAGKVPPTESEILELAAFKLWPRLTYQQTSLPSTKAAVIHFPYTHGFVSAMIFTYKILPKLRTYAAKHGKKGSPITIITTCSVREEMCTHYAPLEDGNKFLLGQPNMEEYVASMPSTPWIDWEILKIRYSKPVMKFAKFLGFSKSDKDEL